MKSEEILKIYQTEAKREKNLIIISGHLQTIDSVYKNLKDSGFDKILEENNIGYCVIGLNPDYPEPRLGDLGSEIHKYLTSKNTEEFEYILTFQNSNVLPPLGFYLLPDLEVKPRVYICYGATTDKGGAEQFKIFKETNASSKINGQYIPYSSPRNTLIELSSIITKGITSIQSVINKLIKLALPTITLELEKKPDESIEEFKKRIDNQKLYQNQIVEDANNNKIHRNIIREHIIGIESVYKAHGFPIIGNYLNKMKSIHFIYGEMDKPIPYQLRDKVIEYSKNFNENIYSYTLIEGGHILSTKDEYLNLADKIIKICKNY